MTTSPTAQASQASPVAATAASPADGARARLLLSAAQVAQLARVQRPVVSMWRSRFAEGPHRFPDPVGSKNSATLFDGHDVATWLIDTGHGNNTEAVEDLSAFSRAEGVDLNNHTHRAVVEALLALRVVSGAQLTNALEPLATSAARTDPADRAFRSEITQRPPHTDWAQYVEGLVESAYSAEGAWHRVQRLAEHRAAAGSAGELSDAAADALARIVLALMPPETLDLALAAGRLADARTVSRVLRAAPEHLSVTVAIPEVETSSAASDLPHKAAQPQATYEAQARHLARYLLVHGEQVNTEPSPAALFIARLRGDDPHADLAALEDLVIELDEWQSALVLGPDTILVDPQQGAAEAARDALLRSGRVRAIVRLPAGWVPAAVRQSLALWVIGGSQREQSIGERISAIGDLRGPALAAVDAADLAVDISSVMGSPALARSHAFTHLRVVRTSALLAGEGPLDARGAKPAVQAPAVSDGLRAVEYAVRIDEALSQLSGTSLTATAGRPAAPTTVAEQLRQGCVRVLPGARIARDHWSCATGNEPAEGYPVIGADEVRAGGVGDRRIDRTLLVTAYPRAELSEPGDVIFLSGSRPAAWVDPVGLSVVVFPARILRIAAGPSASPQRGDEARQAAAEQLVPELIAADLAAASPGRPWQQCLLRRVQGPQHAPLSEVLATLQAERARLEKRVADMAAAERLVLNGVAAGVALRPRADPDTTDFHHSLTTEGTH